MFQRLRTAHPLGYCLLTEVLFLALIMVGPLALLYALAFLGVDISRLDDYFLTVLQELFGVGVAVLVLKKTGRLGLVRRRGSGFFNGLLVGMYPLGLICYNLYAKLMFGRPDDKPMRTGTQIFWYFPAACPAP